MHRSWLAVPGGREQITVVDHLGRTLSVTLTRAHVLAGGAHAAIVARIEAAGDQKPKTR